MYIHIDDPTRVHVHIDDPTHVHVHIDDPTHVRVHTCIKGGRGHCRGLGGGGSTKWLLVAIARGCVLKIYYNFRPK